MSRRVFSLLLGLVLVSGCVQSQGSAADDSSQVPSPTESASFPDPSTPLATATPTAEPTNPVARPPVHVLVVSNGFYPANPTYELNVTSIPSNVTVILTYKDEDLNPLGKHDWTLEGVEGAQTPEVATGEEATIEFTAPLEPGTYAYYCSVPQHRGFGMEGTLVVT